MMGVCNQIVIYIGVVYAHVHFGVQSNIVLDKLAGKANMPVSRDLPRRHMELIAF